MATSVMRKLLAWSAFLGLCEGAYVSLAQYILGKSDEWSSEVLFILFIIYMFIDPLKGLRDELHKR